MAGYTYQAHYKQNKGSAYHSSNGNGSNAAEDALRTLHDTIYVRIRKLRWGLFPYRRAGLVSRGSAGCAGDSKALVLSYIRSSEQACLIERLMGKDNCQQARDIDLTRHPVIELRLAPDHFAIELILSPLAWWDQRNAIGKLTVERHRAGLRELLGHMDDDAIFGFWEGLHQDEMSLANWQLQRGTVLNEWMNTFADGQDYLRVGMWYEADVLTDDINEFAEEALHQMGLLYDLHEFIAWSSDNNYHPFYTRR